VSSRTPTRIDTAAVALRGTAPPVAAFFTSLGYWPALTLLGIAVLGLLVTRTSHAWLPAAFVASHALSQATIVAIKPLFHRTRPDDWLLRHEIDTSYPSGHSGTAMTFFLGLIVLVWHARFPAPIQILASIALGICVIGIPWSRLALGAHYLTDVLGGLLFGTAWLAASIAVYVSYAR
jgi:membrane-associated phospholipid phosphatase